MVRDDFDDITEEARLRRTDGYYSEEYPAGPHPTGRRPAGPRPTRPNSAELHSAEMSRGGMLESGENPVGGRLYSWVTPKDFLDKHSHMYDALIKSFGGYEDDARESFWANLPEEKRAELLYHARSGMDPYSMYLSPRRA